MKSLPSRRPSRRGTPAERIDTPEDEKLARERARAYVPPSQRLRDPIFDMPYIEHTNRTGEKAGQQAPAYLERREKKRPLAALLGGFPIARSRDA